MLVTRASEERKNVVCFLTIFWHFAVDKLDVATLFSYLQWETEKGV